MRPSTEEAIYLWAGSCQDRGMVVQEALLEDEAYLVAHDGTPESQAALASVLNRWVWSVHIRCPEWWAAQVMEPDRGI